MFELPYIVMIKSPLPRSTEICISLVTESLYWSRPPGLLSAAGSILVMVCVVCMAAHNTILSCIKAVYNKSCDVEKCNKDNLV